MVSLFDLLHTCKIYFENDFLTLLTIEREGEESKERRRRKRHDYHEEYTDTHRGGIQKQQTDVHQNKLHRLDIQDEKRGGKIMNRREREIDWGTCIDIMRQQTGRKGQSIAF